MATSFFEIIIYKYYKWTCRWDKDPDFAVIKPITILGFFNMFQLYTLLIALSIVFPSIEFILKPNRIIVLLVYSMLVYLNYVVFFKGKGIKYYIEQYKKRKKNFWFNIYAFGYALGTVLIAIGVAVLSKNIHN